MYISISIYIYLYIYIHICIYIYIHTSIKSNPIILLFFKFFMTVIIILNCWILSRVYIWFLFYRTLLLPWRQHPPPADLSRACAWASEPPVRIHHQEELSIKNCEDAEKKSVKRQAPGAGSTRMLKRRLVVVVVVVVVAAAADSREPAQTPVAVQGRNPTPRCPSAVQPLARPGSVCVCACVCRALKRLLVVNNHPK